MIEIRTERYNLTRFDVCLLSNDFLIEILERDSFFVHHSRLPYTRINFSFSWKTKIYCADEFLQRCQNTAFPIDIGSRYNELKVMANNIVSNSGNLKSVNTKKITSISNFFSYDVVFFYLMPSFLIKMITSLISPYNILMGRETISVTRGDITRCYYNFSSYSKYRLIEAGLSQVHESLKGIVVSGPRHLNPISFFVGSGVVGWNLEIKHSAIRDYDDLPSARLEFRSMQYKNKDVGESSEAMSFDDMFVQAGIKFEDEQKSKEKSKRKYNTKKPKGRYDINGPGWIYLIKADEGEMKDTYKIGHSIHPDERYSKQIKPKLPFKSSLIFFRKVENMKKAEDFFHKKFADQRKNGEWFSLSEKDVNYIKCASIEG